MLYIYTAKIRKGKYRFDVLGSFSINRGTDRPITVAEFRLRKNHQIDHISHISASKCRNVKIMKMKEMLHFLN